MFAKEELLGRPDAVPFVATWGELRWIFDEVSAAGVEMTVGRVTILPGQHNPEHAHPNCEELLFVLSGTCLHSVGDDVVTLQAGALIRIPRGIRHRAQCTSDTPLEALIVFSSPARETVTFEGGEMA